MTENYQPPKHEKLLYLESQKQLWIVGSPDKAFTVTSQEAISLGLALMENGLHLKKQGL